MMCLSRSLLSSAYKCHWLVYNSNFSSHAVLEIIVKRKQRNQYRSQILRGKLALVDLAGRLVISATALF
jgi:aminopeptidase-like protein